MIAKEELLKRLDKLECNKCQDTHPFLHELIVDYLLENFDLTEKENKEAISG